MHSTVPALASMPLREAVMSDILMLNMELARSMAQLEALQREVDQLAVSKTKRNVLPTLRDAARRTREAAERLASVIRAIEQGAAGSMQ